MGFCIGDFNDILIKAKPEELKHNNNMLVSCLN